MSEEHKTLDDFGDWLLELFNEFDYNIEPMFKKEADSPLVKAALKLDDAAEFLRKADVCYEGTQPIYRALEKAMIEFYNAVENGTIKKKTLEIDERKTKIEG